MESNITQQRPQMPQIDFLPKEFREENKKQKIHVWRLIVVCSIVAMLAIGATLQLRIKSNLESDLATIQPLHASAMSRTQQFGALQKERKELDDRAGLVTYLHRDWPKSQILLATLRHLPETVSLKELRMLSAAAPSSKRPDNPETADQDKKEEELKTVSPTRRDLDLLRTEHDGQVILVTLSGSTRDASQLHLYVRTVLQEPLVAKAELLSMERSGSGDSHSTFRMRLVIRAEYGKPDGPASAPDKRGTHASSRIQASGQQDLFPSGIPIKQLTTESISQDKAS